MRLVWGRVARVERVSDDLERLEVAIAPVADEDATGQDATGHDTIREAQTAAAINYPALAGHCTAGERVLLNTTAVELGLGTGGAHFVVAREPHVSDPVALDRPSGGHIMKLRYSPLQLDVLAVEEPASESHEVMVTASDLGGMPVACCGLHSQVPLVAAAVKTLDPSLAVAYVMTDFASLPLPLSDTVRACAEAGLVDATVTCGQAFGGTYEAVNLHSGLLAARHVAHADVAIVAIGPGVVGTATPFGHGGVAQGEAINAVAALGGRPVAALRVSLADPRSRHRPVSHHTLVALGTIALAESTVAVPTLGAEILPGQSVSSGAEPTPGPIERALEDAGVWERHIRHVAPPFEVDLRGLRVASMGRSAEDDPAFFAAAYAAGHACVTLLEDAGIGLSKGAPT